MKRSRAIVFFLVAGITSIAHAADDSRWAAFGTASDVDPEQSGVGGGASARWEWQDDVYFTGNVFGATYEDFDRVQLLFGGEWVDRIGSAAGYVGAEVGAEVVRADNYDNEDLFGRIHYDIGWRVGKTSELRIGVAYDVKVDNDRKGGVRVGWYANRDNGTGFFVKAEAYKNEANVFAGLSWPL